MWEFLEVFMIGLYLVFYLIIVFVNHHDYFGKNQDNFYLNIFEINFAAVMMRWAGQMTDKFMREEYPKENESYTKLEFQSLYLVSVFIYSFIFLLIWYIVDFFQNPYQI